MRLRAPGVSAALTLQDRDFFIDNLLVHHRDDLVDRPRATGVRIHFTA